MECNDEAVERQQLVNGNDEDDDNTTTITGGHNDGGCSTSKSAVPTPISPIKVTIPFHSFHFLQRLPNFYSKFYFQFFFGRKNFTGL